MVVINIDTSKDSHDEIRQTIRYLQSLVGDTPDASPASSPVAEPMNEFAGMMGIFDDTESQEDAAPASTGSSSSQKKSEAEQLLEESDEMNIEVEDDKDSFIEIVEYN